jgi:sigma-B regulation protein RsbU (phosphoserine phosphatase)
MAGELITPRCATRASYDRFVNPMRLRSALVLGVLPLVAVVLVVSAVVVVEVLSGAARRDLDEDLARTARVFDDLQAYRQWVIRSQSRVVVDEPRLKEAVATEPVTHEAVLGVAADIHHALQSDLFLITDGRGRLLADIGDPAAEGNDLSQKPLVAGALAAGEAAGIWTDGRDAYQVYARRLSSGAATVGVLLIGFRINVRVAEIVHRQTDSSIAVELDGEPIAVAPERLRLDRAALARVPTGAAPVELHSGGARLLAIAELWPGARPDQKLRLVILRSLDDALAPARHVTGILVGVLAAALAAALVLALGLARWLGRPLEGLEAFTRTIAAGKKSARAEVSGVEEVRSLGRAMNKLVGDLAESRRALSARERGEKEAEIGSRIQTSIAPRAVQTPGVELAVRALPGAAAEGGSDYYDLIPVEGGCFLALGDLAAEGLAASVVRVMVQSVVAALCRAHPGGRPRDVLAALNQVLFENVRLRMGKEARVSLALVSYRRDGRLVAAGARQGLVVCRAGGVERLALDGEPLGESELGAAHADVERPLSDGDLLLLCSAGAVERTNGEGERLGLDRVVAALEAARGEPIDRIADRLADLATEWTGGHTPAATLLVLRHRA